MSGTVDPNLNSRLDALEALVGELRKEVGELKQQAVAAADADTLSRLGLAEGERRTVTVLFADVSGFTTLAERLDPEDCNAIMRETLGAIAQAVTDEGGHVEKFIGDAVCALFGAPIAYEDEPQRAARSALRMHRVLEELAQRRPNLPALTVHIGINTGPVIAGGVGDGSQFGVMGDTINTAARLMDAAESRQTFVSAATARRLRRGFELAEAGTLKLKGKADQIVTYELLSPREEEAVAPKLVAPFIGRERELKVITTEPRGATVIVADAGMGKSRFFDEAEKELEGEATVLRATVIGFDAVPLDLASDAFRPLIEAMPEGPARDICWTLIDGNPEHFHGDLPGALRDLLEAEAQRQRIVALLDGIEVADASSAALLRFLLPATADIDVHWVLGTRPGSPSASALASTAPEHRQLTLEPVGVDATVRILMALLPGAIDESTALALAPRVAGNPEFCAEIAQAFVEEGLVVEDGNGWRAVGDVANLVVPGTLKEMVEARVESLDSAARQVIQAAAVIGGLFDPNVLKSVVPVAGSVDSALADLSSADLVRPPLAKGGKWMFRAPIAQEVVYDSILKRRRPELHLRVAEAKLALAEDPSDVAETLAFHFSAAGDTERAAEHLAVAARRALLSHGYAAAAELATRSFALSKSTSPALLGLRAKARFLAGDISGAVRDVDDIVVTDPEPRALHHATWVLFAAEHVGTRGIAERVLAATGHPYAPAATAALAVANAAMGGSVAASVGVDASGPTEPHVLLAEGLLALWRGESEKAYDLLRSSHEVAAATDHPLVAVLADEAQAEALVALGDVEGAAAMARSLDALTREREDAAGLARVKVIAAEAALLAGDAGAAIATAQLVLAAPAATTTTRARAMSVLARAHAHAGDADEARRLAAGATTAAEGLWLGWRIREQSAIA